VQRRLGKDRGQGKRQGTVEREKKRGERDFSSFSVALSCSKKITYGFYRYSDAASFGGGG
jgi:hypothetical protein